MGSVIDKSAIMLICAVSFAFCDGFAVPVVGLLLLLTVSSLTVVLSDKKFTFLLLSAYSLLCAFLPMFFCGAPLLLYDALRMRKVWAILPLVTIVGSIGSFGSLQLPVILTGCAFALVFYFRVVKLEEHVNELRTLRDDTAEKNMLLDVKNRRLAEAQDNEVRLATLKERNRIAREIHDNVGHMLTRSLLQSGALIVLNKDEQLKEPLESLRSTLDSAMTSIRVSVHDLHDDSIDLRKVIEDSLSTAQEKFKVKLDYDARDDIPTNIKMCIAGIVKEGVSNAVKHSSGDVLTVSVREHPAFFQLLIEDNGRCSEIRESGIGLKNMRERAENAGGVITFTPSEDGFRIFTSIPKN